MERSRMASETQNWFDRGGDAYARYRPDYPDELAGFMAEAAPDTRLALDVGCGNGQFTRQLGDHFDAVVGSDPSAEQIAHAVPHPRVRYEVGPAERLGAEARSVSLITAAQAAHWFDLPRFYAEARRVATAGAVIALISYGVARLDPELDARFQSFYGDELRSYWPPERRLVDTGYASVDFPFRALPAPDLRIIRDWSAEAFLGYISTWSAIRRVREAGRDAILAAFSRDVLKLWGDPEVPRRITWPINMRLGIIE